MRLIGALGLLAGSLLGATACGDDSDTGGAGGSGASSGSSGGGSAGASASGGVGASGGSSASGGVAGSPSGGAAGSTTGGAAGSTTGGASGAGGTGGAAGAGGTGAVAGTGGAGSGFSLRFFGNGGIFDDRVLIRLDDPNTTAAGPPVDVGGTDFTIEFWMKAAASDNTNGAISCGQNINWINGNIIVDRDRHSQPPKYGLSIGGGRLAWGVTGPGGNSRTICGTANVLTNQWVHVAVQRKLSNGTMWILVGGKVDARAVGPTGDVSYPDNGNPQNVCPAGSCDYSDPFLSIGAEKHGYGSISYNGLVDELRISTTLRYGEPNVGQSYTVPKAPLSNDANAVGLYHFDDGSGNVVSDSSGPSGVDGVRKFGGSPAGPVWTQDSPF